MGHCWKAEAASTSGTSPKPSAKYLSSRRPAAALAPSSGWVARDSSTSTAPASSTWARYVVLVMVYPSWDSLPTRSTRDKTFRAL